MLSPWEKKGGTYGRGTYFAIYIVDMHTESNIILQSSRLILRHWEESDKEELYALASDPAVGPMAGWLPHKDVQDSLLVIRNILSEDGTFAIILKETGKLIGSTGLFRPQCKECEVFPADKEVGYWIGQKYWGNGYATEAVETMLRYAFSCPETRRVWCAAFHKNERSIRVQEKCGFTYDHTENVFVSPLGEERTEHFTLLEREKWEKRKENN